MLRKFQQFHILLALLICVYTFCPLFCEVFGQKLCNRSAGNILVADTTSCSTCCQKTNATEESENTSENETVCCLNSLNLILPDIPYHGDVIRESLERSIVTIFSVSIIPPYYQELLHYLPTPPKHFITQIYSDITRRGPPYILS